MKVLTIGNSFAVNSCKYLAELFKSGGNELTLGCANLGGCTLERHWNNAKDDAPVYGAQWFNGERTLKDMLTSEAWDVVTLQQASHESWRIGSYYPYIDLLAEYVKKYAPQAEIMIHETWAYRTDNTRLCEEFKISQAQMFALLKENYIEIAAHLGARILPVGEALRIMQEETCDKIGELTRNPDGPSHANVLGEYIGGLVWYAVLTGQSIETLGYVPEGVAAEYVPAAKKSAQAAVSMYNR